MARPMAVVLVDFGNLWMCAVNDFRAAKENPVDMGFIAQALKKITTHLIQRGKEVVVFVFFPSHYSRFSAALENLQESIFIFCPKFNGANGDQHDVADQCIYLLGSIIQGRSNRRSKISDLFVFGRLRAILKSAESHYRSGKLSVFWSDYFTEEPVELRRRIRTNLSRFYENLDRITDVCIVSGDGDFIYLIQNLKEMGINVSLAAPLWRSTSLALIKAADEFIEITPNV